MKLPKERIAQVGRLALALTITGSVFASIAMSLNSGQEAKPEVEVPKGMSVATFAGGCFWCMEPPFDKLDGVVSTTSGYTDGSVKNPSYEQVSMWRTGHTEAVQIVYDPSKLSYEKLLDVFWRNIDPTDAGGQFCDRGSQYRSGVFAHDEEQLQIAESSKAKLASSGVLEKEIVTEVKKASTFYAAEEYHQDYYKKNPFRYKLYRTGCGRDRTLRRVWKNAS